MFLSKTTKKLAKSFEHIKVPKKENKKSVFPKAKINVLNKSKTKIRA
jgi:hypothetical protein